ncbi:hypothetical protein [Lacipirellula sp.]|uniref:hypothetical protein n=1 Tax=Lacipirellula sp. TaxID=2691419 RepID=UPI003D09DB3F
MNLSHLSLLDSCSTRSNKEVAAWAHREGKSETMAADLLRSTLHQRKQQQQTIASAGTFCPRCIASATLGAALALLLDRIILSGY